MRTKEDRIDKALHYIMGRVVPAYLGFIIAIFMALVLFGCQSEPPKPEEIELTQVPSLPGGNCSRSGHIVKKVRISDGLEWLLVRDNQNEEGTYWGAIAPKQENLKTRDLVEICYVNALHTAPSNQYHQQLGYARKTLHSFYEPSELEKYEQCQEDLKDGQYELAKCNLLYGLCEKKANTDDDLIEAYETLCKCPSGLKKTSKSPKPSKDSSCDLGECAHEPENESGGAP